MKKTPGTFRRCAALVAMGFVLALSGTVFAEIPGVPGPTFDLIVKDGFISTADGNSVYAWGYGVLGNGMQYVGPTLVVDEGDTVTVNLTHKIARYPSMPVSIVFPGQQDVVATGGSIDGLLTRECVHEETVTYTFTAGHAGTFQYHSGTRPELQIEMGMVGALIVHPTGYDPMSPTVYGDSLSAYDHENLYLLTEMDPDIHEIVLFLGPDTPVLANRGLFSNYAPKYWFINGRCAPDTMMASGGVSGLSKFWLRKQPYNCMPMMHPGDKLLLRVITAGRDMHPFHTHGNHVRIIAEEGRLMSSNPLAGLDLNEKVFSIHAIPGETVDAIFEWTGARLGWDMYGHSPADPLEPNEYGPDHGKPFPVVLPENQDLTFGGFYSGSPFLGAGGSLPPGEGGLNPYAGFFYMWHSHTEKEMTNYDIFPGGMMTMFVVLPPGVMTP